MSIEQCVDYLNISAGQDLSAYQNDNTGVIHKAVYLNGTIAAGPTYVGGLLKSKGKSGEGVRIAYQGVAKGWAGAAVNTIGAPVTITASGFLTAATSGQGIIGRAFATANSGDLFPIMLDGGLGYWNGL